MRDKLLIKLADLAVTRTRLMMTAVIILTLFFGYLSEQIEYTTKWSDMLPKGDKRTVEFDRILEEFVSASSIVIVVQGEENQIKAFADDIAPQLLQPLPVPDNDIEKKVYVRRVDYKQEVDFIQEHGFMLMKESDLKNMKNVFQNEGLLPLLTNINDSFEKEYIQTDESLSTREKEDGAYMFLDGIETWLDIMERRINGEDVDISETHAAVDKLLTGDPYFISYDRQALILNVIPNFSMMDMDLMIDGTDAVQTLVDEMLKKYPNVSAGLTGSIPLGHDEMVYGMEGLEVTSIIAFIAIGALLFVSFRMWVAPVLALTNLMVGLIWAAGVSSLLVPVISVMSMMFMVVLIGLGIDFSIHIISSFTEMRAIGQPLHEAMRNGLLKTGKGVMTGALTTASAFLALMIGDSRLMSEMGLLTGIGLLAIAVTTFTLLPGLLVIRERHREKKFIKKGLPVERKSRDISFVVLGNLGVALKKRYQFTILGAVVLTGLLTWSAFNITFDYNFMNIEPEGIPSITLQDTVLDKFDLSMDFAYLVAVGEDESRFLAEQAKEYSSVATVEDISLYLPSAEEQEKRKPHIKEIQHLISSAKTTQLYTLEDLNMLNQEIERLEMNIMEMQVLAFLGRQDKVDQKCRMLAGDPDYEPTETIFTRLKSLMDSQDKVVLVGLNSFQNDYSDYFKKRVLKMTNMDPISLENLPVSILDRYSNRDRTLFLVTVLPGHNIWQDAKFLDRFTDDLEEISTRATGFPPVFRALIDIIGRDGRNAALLTIIVVFFLLWIDFRHPGHALMAMIPLAAGMVWMVGIMALVGKQLDVVNVMGIPMILGIGIDDGVHIVHRWRREGFDSVRTVFSSTGKAILLTSLTTILAFGSLVFSIWRGYGSLGIALSIGVTTCFLATILIIPAVMGWGE
ncbi:MAG: MMPL family transporter, partial [Candidatus Marinimicrobia bacterium]|nr:MMPL family transporter [Candidatus Neomarinimicrobiota bacterium]